MKLLFSFLLLVSCKAGHQTRVRKNIEATIVICYERPSNSEYYFLKSRKIFLDNTYFDLLEWIPSGSHLDLLLKTKGINSITPGSHCTYYDPDFDTGVYYSKYTYNWHLLEEEVYIIYKAKLSVVFVKLLPKDIKYGIYNHYSCPIELDTLNVPFYKALKIDSCYYTDPDWLVYNGYYKMESDSFRTWFCD